MNKRKLAKTDYIDGEGIRRRALVDSETTPAEEGIPASIRLEAELVGTSPEFRRRLYSELEARGLIEPQDFLAPNALKRIQAAVLAAVAVDAQTIQAIARRQHNGSTT